MQKTRARKLNCFSLSNGGGEKVVDCHPAPLPSATSTVVGTQLFKLLGAGSFTLPRVRRNRLGRSVAGQSCSRATFF